VAGAKKPGLPSVPADAARRVVELTRCARCGALSLSQDPALAFRRRARAYCRRASRPQSQLKRKGPLKVRRQRAVDIARGKDSATLPIRRSSVASIGVDRKRKEGPSRECRRARGGKELSLAGTGILIETVDGCTYKPSNRTGKIPVRLLFWIGD
jgi:hypothetical protein